MRRKLTAIALCAVAMALFLVGCSASQGETPNSAAQNTKTSAAVGDTVTASTEYGDLNITIDGFEISQAATDDYSAYDPDSTEVPEGTMIGVLMLVVENVSYSDPYNDGYVLLDNAMRLEGQDGITITSKNTAYDYGQYGGCAGGFMECAEGQAVRVACFYCIPADTTEITAVIGNTEIPIQASTV